MRIEFTKNFIKSYNKRIRNNPKLIKQTDSRILLFLKDRFSPLLKDHKLEGERNAERSFSITGDIRIVYMELPDYYLFLDIGTHNQVY